METQVPKNKAVKVSVSIYSDQIERIHRLVNFDRFGLFSRFVQSAVEEKLNRMEADAELTERLSKAS